jgi:hypothetical protein
MVVVINNSTAMGSTSDKFGVSLVSYTAFGSNVDTLNGITSVTFTSETSPTLATATPASQTCIATVTPANGT